MTVPLSISTTSICVFLVAASIAAGAWAPPSARAQSAEEAVAFFMWGLEHSSRVGLIAANTWAVADADGRMSAFEIRRLNECRYDVHIQRPLMEGSVMLKLEYSLDFSAVTDYDAWLANDRGKAIIIKIEGTRWYSKRVVNQVSGRVLQDIKGGRVDANVAAGGSVERLRSAFVDFRASHCKRRGSWGPSRQHGLSLSIQPCMRAPQQGQSRDGSDCLASAFH